MYAPFVDVDYLGWCVERTLRGMFSSLSNMNIRGFFMVNKVVDDVLDKQAEQGEFVILSLVEMLAEFKRVGCVLRTFWVLVNIDDGAWSAPCCV